MQGHISSDRISTFLKNISFKSYNFNGVLLIEIDTELNFKSFNSLFQPTGFTTNKLLMYCDKNGVFYPLVPFRHLKRTMPKLDLYKFTESISLLPSSGIMKLADIKFNLVSEWVYFMGATEQSRNFKGQFMIVPLEEMLYHPLILLYSYYLNPVGINQNCQLKLLLQNVADECQIDLTRVPKNGLFGTKQCCSIDKIDYFYLEKYRPLFHVDEWIYYASDDFVALESRGKSYMITYSKDTYLVESISKCKTILCNRRFRDDALVRYSILQDIQLSGITHCSFFKDFEFP